LRSAAAVLLLLWASAPALADDAMVQAAKRFYAVYGSFHPSDGIPDAGGRARLAPVLSERLNRQLADAARVEDRFDARNRGAPPLLEGDLFTSMFEGATSWSVEGCSGDGRTVRCTVALAHAQPGQKTVTWTDTLYLVAGSGGWRVDDIGYGGRFAFGNTGRLSQTLQSVTSAAQ
jgi:hypothetical protein